MIWTQTSPTLETLIHPLMMTSVSAYVPEFHRYRYGRSVYGRNWHATAMDCGGSWFQHSLLVDMHSLHKALEQTLQCQVGIPCYLLNISGNYILYRPFIHRSEKYEASGGKNG